MSAVIIQNKKGKILIINKLSYPEEVNFGVISAISSGIIPGCLPVEVKTKHKETVIECAVEGLLTLEQFFQGAVTKPMFLTLAHHIAQIIIGCEKSRINPNCLDLRIDRIFTDPVTGNVKCIYWPVINSQVNADIRLFLQQLPYCVKINPNQDYSYLNQYVAFFNTNQEFNIRSFDNMLAALYSDQPVPGTEAAAVVSGQSSGRLNSRVGMSAALGDGGTISASSASRDLTLINDLTVCPSCGAENLAVSNFCIVCGTKLSKTSQSLTASPQTNNSGEGREDGSVPASDAVPSELSAEHILENKTAQGEALPKPDAAENNPAAQKTSDGNMDTTVLFNEVSDANKIQPDTAYTQNFSAGKSPDSFGTVVEGYNNPQEKTAAFLTRLKNGEKTEIDKPVFKIGSARDSCNMVITENRYISRIHAYAVTRDGRYFIIDRNSTNKTYVDGKAIPTETEVEIFNDTKIKFANEEFIFNVIVK